ncbi:MAG: hypothetical protein ACP5VQ_11730, partial [Phycisphaerae bacterium]
MWTKVSMAAMFHYRYRELRYFHLLKFTWWLLQWSHSAAAIRTAIHFVVHHPVDLGGSVNMSLSTAWKCGGLSPSA